MELPIYLATIENIDEGIFGMSLVNEPATMVNWVTFNEDTKIEKFAIQNEEEHLLCGVVMLADTNIYRRDGDYEYYIRYTKDTIKIMAEKMLKDKTFNNIDFQHNFEYIQDDKVTLVELFIKDEAKGINPNYFENIPDGSLLCTYKVNDEEIWELCKNGTFQGFSITGRFTPVLKKENYNKQDKKMNFMNKLKQMLAKVLLTMGAVATDKGSLIWESEEDLKEGMFVSKEDGSVAEDGEYKTEDGKVITVKESIVEKIADEEAEVAPEAEAEPVAVEEPVAEPDEEEMKKKKCMEEEAPVEEPAEEPAEEEAPAEEPAEPEFDAKAEIEALKAEIETLKASLAELIQKPAAEPIAQEFSKVVNVEKTGDKGLDKAISRFSTLKH